MRPTIFLLMVCLISLTIKSRSQNTTIFLRPIEDALVSSAEPNKNYGSMIDWATWDWANWGISRSFMKFDVSLVPSGATIISAKINLYHNLNTSNSGHYGSNTSYLQRITSNWNEYQVNWSNQPTTTPVNQVLLQQSTSIYQSYENIDITDLIKDIYANQSSSHGIAIRLQTEGTYRSMKFTARDFPDTTKHILIELTYHLSPLLINVSTADVSCHEKCDGSVSASISHGNPPFTYTWSTGDTTSSISGLCAGYYSVTVTSSGGIFSQTQSVNLIEPSEVNLIGSGPYLTRKGQSIAIYAQASGGTPPYSYFWNTVYGTHMNMVSPESTTTFYVYAVDANGCLSNVDSIIVKVYSISSNPNPFIDECIIEFDGINLESIDIFDILGRRIELPVSLKEKRILIHTENILPGVYVVKCSLSDNTNVTFIKVKTM